ncbi:hypothetical protein QBC32DRAFT_399931 [Pseudoneurospora amorphoporcata]|uniref:Uncharacterized protein n=1 Tax=Pseudoneurospora amorphoporcata TaxID=241081 RepID=A0AAN6NPW5_9PEZI|nr:hypothetical protein QBC32DRAFT_399931 [Pseudoneurospora amorphoporcata]
MAGTRIATMVDFTGGALNAAILHETPIFTFSRERPFLASDFLAPPPVAAPKAWERVPVIALRRCGPRQIWKRVGGLVIPPPVDPVFVELDSRGRGQRKRARTERYVPTFANYNVDERYYAIHNGTPDLAEARAYLSAAASYLAREAPDPRLVAKILARRATYPDDRLSYVPRKRHNSRWPLQRLTNPTRMLAEMQPYIELNVPAEPETVEPAHHIQGTQLMRRSTRRASSRLSLIPSEESPNKMDFSPIRPPASRIMSPVKRSPTKLSSPRKVAESPLRKFRVTATPTKVILKPSRLSLSTQTPVKSTPLKSTPIRPASVSESDSEVTPAHLLHLSPLLFDQPIPETPRSDARPSFITRLLKEFERDAPERRHSFSLAVQAVADATITSRRNSVDPSCIGSDDAAVRENTEDSQEQTVEQEPVPPAPTRTLEVDVGTNLDIFGHRRKDVQPLAQTPTPTRYAQMPIEGSTVASSPPNAVVDVSLTVEPLGFAPPIPSIAAVDNAEGVTNSENDANLPPAQVSRDPTPEPISPDQQPEGEESPAPLIVEESTNTEMEANNDFEPLHPEGLSTILEEDSVLEAFTPVKLHNLPTRSSPMKPASPLPLGLVTLGTPAVGASSPAVIHQESISLQELPSEAPSSPTPVRRVTPEKLGFGSQLSAASHRRYSAAHELLTEAASPAPTAEKSAIGASSPATSQQDLVATREKPEEMSSEIEAARQTTPENHDDDALPTTVAEHDDKISEEVTENVTSSPAPVCQATPEALITSTAPVVTSSNESTTQDGTIEEEASAPTSPREVTPEIANINVSFSPVRDDGNIDQPSENALAPSIPLQQANPSPLVGVQETIIVQPESSRSATPGFSPASPAPVVEDGTAEEADEDTPATPTSASSIRSNSSVGLVKTEEHKEEPATGESSIKGENDDAAHPIEPNSPCNNGQEKGTGLPSPEPALGPEEQSSPNGEITCEDDITLSENHVAATEDVMAESHSSPQSGGVGDNEQTDSSASFVDSFVPTNKDANEITVPPTEDKEDEAADTSSVMDQDESVDRSMSTEQFTSGELSPACADALEDSSTSQIRESTPEEESDSIEAAPTEAEDVGDTQENSPESSTSSSGDSDDENSGDEIEVVEQVGAEDSLMSDDEDDVSLIAEQPVRVENDTLSLRSLHEESETDMIRKFISKVAADKSAKAAAAAELENRSSPKDESGSPAEDSETPPKRTPLSEKSPNSPSPTKKRKLDELGSEPSKEEFPKTAGESPVTRTVKRRKAMVENSEPPAEEGDDSEGAPRRSSRQRKTLINLKSAPSANSIAKSTIPVRMPGMEMMDTVRARNDQKDVAAVTRYNTRKNKGSALFPQMVLKKMEKMKKQGKEYVFSSSSADNDKATETGKKKKNKGVRWAETLARFQDDAASAPANSKTRALSSSLLADVLKADAALDDDIDELAGEPVVSSKKVATPRVLKAKSQIKSRTDSAPEVTSKPSIPKPKKVAPPPPTPTTRRATAASSIPAPAPTPTTKRLPTPAPKPTTSISKVTAPPKRATRSGKSLVPTPIKVTATTKPKTTVPAAPPPSPAPHRGPSRPRLNPASSTATSTPISNKVTKTPAATSKTVVTAAAGRASRVAAGLGMSVNGTPAPKRKGRSAS